MFGERPASDFVRVCRGFLTNQVARLSPTAYMRLASQTGRGDKSGETPAGVAQYFRSCFDDYFRVLGVDRAGIGPWLTGKRLIEYGPGDTPGVALLMLAHGAKSVTCVDRFPLVNVSAFFKAVVADLIAGLDEVGRGRVLAALVNPERPEVGFRPECLSYLVTPSGLSGVREAADLVYSRAVLEHVDDITATFDDMAKALVHGGVAIHQVDLKSHGLHSRTPLDFLTWPPGLWDLMYSQKGVPNRWRIDRYRIELDRVGLAVDVLEPTARYTEDEVREVLPRLARRFQGVSAEDLTWKGFWLVCHRG